MAWKLAGILVALIGICLVASASMAAVPLALMILRGVLGYGVSGEAFKFIPVLLVWISGVIFIFAGVRGVLETRKAKSYSGVHFPLEIAPARSA